jgi:hypothetical protein
MRSRLGSGSKGWITVDGREGRTPVTVANWPIISEGLEPEPCHHRLTVSIKSIYSVQSEAPIKATADLDYLGQSGSYCGEIIASRS